MFASPDEAGDILAKAKERQARQYPLSANAPTDGTSTQ
jgi:hypothetical protein